MAVTASVLIWLGSVAVLANIGMFIQMDRTSTILVPFVSAITWGIVAIAAGNVVVPTDSLASVSMPSVTYLALAMAVTSGMFGIYELVAGGAKDVSESARDSPLLED